MQASPFDGAPAAAARTALSLKQVAEKVVSYFKTYTAPQFDINDVAAQLNVPKRRLYDVLNIMAPLGLVERNGRGKYTWTGQMQPSMAPPQISRGDTDKSHVRDLSLKFLQFIRETDQNTISIGSICGSVFEDKKGQLRRFYDISAVFEVLNLVKRQPKSGDFLITPLLRGLFITKMLPPKKRAPLASIPFNRVENYNESKLVSPPNIQGRIVNGQIWLGATTFQ